MRASLEFLAAAPRLEPYRGSTGRLLLAAREERHLREQRRARVGARLGWGKALAYGTALIVLSTVCFGAASRQAGPVPEAGGQYAITERITAAAPSAEELRKAAFYIQALAVAASFPSEKPPSLWEAAHRRAVRALDADLVEAVRALERNPGCERAGRVVGHNLQRQTQLLKALYAERKL